MVVMVTMEPVKVLSMMVYLAFESVGMLNVVADTALNDISAKNANKAFFISLSPSVNDAAIVAEGKRYDKATCSLIRMFSGTIAR